MSQARMCITTFDPMKFHGQSHWTGVLKPAAKRSRSGVAWTDDSGVERGVRKPVECEAG